MSLPSPLSFLLSDIYAQPYRFRHLTTGDGLPINFTWKVIQDSRGFIWITTRSGVCRYDGYNMTVYQYDSSDSSSLSDNRIVNTHSIVEDDSGRIWIGTNDGLNRFDPFTGKFRRYYHDPVDPGSISNSYILSVYKDNTGTLWIGTGWRGGLNKYDPVRDRFIVYKSILGDTSLQVTGILDLCEDRNGTFWVGTGNCLYQFDREQGLFIQIPFNDALAASPDPIQIKTIYEDTDGTMFFGTQNGFLTYDTIKKIVIPYEPLYFELFNLRFVNIRSDPFTYDPLLWIALGNVYLFNKRTLEVFPLLPDPADPSSIRGNVVKSFFLDASGVFWIPGTNGVNMLNPHENQIEEYSGFGKKYGDAMSFAEDQSGHLWIGTIHCLVHLDQKMNVVRVYDSVSFNVDHNAFHGDLWCLYSDSKNNLWIGNQVEGLFLLENGTDNIKRCTFSGAENKDKPVFIYEIYEDSQGTLWIGTDENGLYRREKQDMPLICFRNDSIIETLKTSLTITILEDHYGALWFGTAGEGLFYQPPELRGTSRFLNYTHDPGDELSLSNNWIWSIYEDTFYQLWIATENGLNKYIRETNRFERYSTQKDLSDNFIYDMTGDNSGNFWLSTENGLIRFYPESETKPTDRSTDFVQIMSHDCIWAYRIFKSREGYIYICGDYNSGKGFYRFHPDSLKENNHIPSIVIVDFRVRNQPILLDSCISLKKNLVLKHNQNFFSFEFAALDYAAPEKNQYAYMLEGLEEGWIYSGNQRFANYTKVPPGEYVFRAKGSNNDGYWNENGASLSVTILPPPWKTWWAYIIYGLFLIGLAYGWRKYDLKRQHLKQALQIEHIEAEKLKELDSIKSRFFANISHEFRTPLTLILGPLEQHMATIRDKTLRQDMGIMQRNANRLQRLIDQLLSLSKLESGQMKLNLSEENMVTLVKSYMQQFESLARQKGIELIYKSEVGVILAFTDRDKIEKILYNLLSNAFKFTPEGGRIEVSVNSQRSAVSSQKSKILNLPTADCQLPTVDLNEQWIVFSISDTGTGIAPEKLPHIFDRFYQAGDSYTKDSEGTGIGLALTKELVELHGGSITVESVVNQGSTFRVYLPLRNEELKSKSKEQRAKSKNQKYFVRVRRTSLDQHLTT